MYTTYNHSISIAPSNKIESFKGTPHSSHPLPTFHSIRGTYLFQLLATCLGNLLRRKPTLITLRSAIFRDLGLSFLLQIPQGPRRRNIILCCHDETGMQRPKEEGNACIQYTCFFYIKLHASVCMCMLHTRLHGSS